MPIQEPPPRSHRTLAIVVAFFLIGSAAGAIWFLTRSAESETQPGGGATIETSTAQEPKGAKRTNDSPEASSANPAASAKAAAELATPTDGLLTVVVTAASKPVAKAAVRLYWKGADRSAAWSNAGEGRTADDGTLKVPARPGAYLVTARAEGFAAGHVETNHPSGGAQTRVQVPLTAGVELVGHTVDWKTHAPVALAEIVVAPQLRAFFRDRSELPDEKRVTTNSDTRGTFRIAGLAPGRWTLEARAPSYAPAHLREVMVPRGELTIELQGAGTIEGTVLRDGKPAPGATVIVTGSNEQTTAETGPAGGYSVVVSPGTLHVTARMDDLTGAAPPVTIAAGAIARGVDVQLGPSATIAGKVRSGTSPVPGAAVAATMHRGVPGFASAVTGADGAYEMRGLAPGSYDVDVTATGHARFVAWGITLRGGERFPLDVVLEDPTAIEGVVSLASGGPASGAIVSLANGGFPGGGGRGVVGETLTGFDGHYRLENATGDRAVVSARKDESSPPALKMVDLVPGQVAKADLVLIEGGIVSGSVVDSKSKPVPGAMVFAIDSSGGGRFGGPGGGPGGGRNAVADESGAFLMPLPPGSFGFAASAPSAPGPGGPRFGGRPQILANANVVIGQRAEVMLILPDDARPTANGHVLEPGGQPSPGAMVQVMPGDTATQVITASGDGTFTYRASPDAPTNLTARNGGRAGTGTADVGATEVTVQLQAAASIQGHLVGDPPPDSFTVTQSTKGAFGPWGGGGPGGPGGGDLQFTGTSFQLDDVTPGQVSVNVKTSDGRIGHGQVTVATGETGKVEIQLSPAATLTGLVLDASTHQPVPRARVLVDGQAGRRGATGPDGRFSRTVTVGQHTVTVNAPGYQDATMQANAAADPATTDLGEISLTPTKPDPGTIGITLGWTNAVIVMGVFPNGPAAQAGVMPGDNLDAVDAVKPASNADAAQKCKGAPGTPVVLTLRRAGSPLTLTVTRAQ